MHPERTDQSNYPPSPSRVFPAHIMDSFVPYCASDRQLKASKYDQKIPQSHTAVQPRHRAEEPQNS